VMTREQAQAIYRAGEETVVRVLCELSREMDQLKADFAVLKAENLALRGECQVLRDEVRSLKEQVAKDSHNSSKPPSSDGLAKPKPKSLRPPSDRPTGGQPGHQGHTLRMVEKPDRTVRHAVERCKDCGQSLAQQAPDRVERRQVFDLPEPKLEVTEHQGEIKTCACGCVNRAAFPAEAAAPVQYGPRVKSVAVYLKEYQLLPFDRLSEIMRDLFACESFSQGTLANFDADCSRRLEPVEAAIRDLATQSEVAGFDETGVRAVGSLHWLHTVSTQFLTWYYAHKRRGARPWMPPESSPSTGVRGPRLLGFVPEIRLQPRLLQRPPPAGTHLPVGGAGSEVGQGHDRPSAGDQGRRRHRPRRRSDRAAGRRP